MDKYINTGVVLWNLKEMRKDNIVEKFLKILPNNYLMQDQDIMNIVCYDKIKLLPLKFNVMTKIINLEKLMIENNIFKYIDLKIAKEQPIIIHYAAPEKPWNANVIYFADWWEYAKNSPYYNNTQNNYFPLLFKDIGLGCNTWCKPKNVTDGDIKSFTYDLSDNIYTRYVSWDPIKEGSCDVEIIRLSAVEKRSKKRVEFPVNKIISSGKISENKVEFRNQKGCWIGCPIEGAYESFTIEAKIKKFN